MSTVMTVEDVREGVYVWKETYAHSRVPNLRTTQCDVGVARDVRTVSVGSELKILRGPKGEGGLVHTYTCTSAL